jgi:hypothetical protein
MILNRRGLKIDISGEFRYHQVLSEITLVLSLEGQFEFKFLTRVTVEDGADAVQ